MRAAAITAELERMERELFRADWAAAEEAWGADVTLARLARTPGQRRSMR